MNKVMLRGPTRVGRNVYDPVFMRNVKKAFAKYQGSMDRTPRRSVSREAFLDMDDKGAAWYLGHMNSTTTELEKKISEVDFVLEMRDARLPFSTENPNLRRLMRGKPHLIIFNKAELAHEEYNLAIQRYYESEGSFALFTSAQRTWRDTVEAVQRFVTNVIPQKTFRTVAHIGLVVGMPNVGKSTLINSLRMAHEYQFHKDDFHRSRTGETVSVHPGTTRGIRMVPISRDPNVVLYDTPGLTLPGCFAKEAGLKLAACGIIPTNDLTLTRALVARYLYDIMTAAGVSEHLAECMHLPRAPVSFDDCMSLICERSGRSAQSELGNLQPIEAQGFLIHDFQQGKLGKLTLDRLPRKVRAHFATGAAEHPRIATAHTSSADDKHDRYESSEDGFTWTYHVEAQDAPPQFPDHLRGVLEEVHFGKVTGVSGRPARGVTRNGGTKRQTSADPRQGDADTFTISRKRGAISRATVMDSALQASVRIKPGR